MKEIIFNYKLLRIFLIIFIIIILLILIIFLFIKFYSPFGAKPSKEDKKNYAKRSKNYVDGKFKNTSDFKLIYKTNDKDNYKSNKDEKPIDEIPIEKTSYLVKPSINILNVTFLGHSSILMQMHGMNILIDPVFSKYTSPVSLIGPKRFSKLPIEIRDLPNIDIVVISHDHYDHLDYNTIKKINDRVSMYVVPLGVENHLERWGVKKDKITNMAWWEEINVNGLTIACTPARHYSSRNMIDKFNTLWSSWVFIDEYYKVFESGDTGFDTHFEEIQKKYGNFDLSLLDSGQYNKKWKYTHMIPEEAVIAGKILNSKIIMPIHYGAFKLSNHPWDDSLERFTTKAKDENMKYITPKIGETITYSDNIKTSNWWKDIK